MKSRYRRTVLMLAVTFVLIWALSGCNSASDIGSEGAKPEKTGETLVSEETEESKVGDRPRAMETDEDKALSGQKSGGETKGQTEEYTGFFAEDGKILPLDMVLELAEKETISWSDFHGYKYVDVGSGLMIHEYETDGNFSVIVGGTGEGAPMYVRLKAEDGTDDYADMLEDDVRKYMEEHRKPEVLVGITAHVKETRGYELLISSDTDQFPGVFLVYGYQEAAGEAPVKGGTQIRILMKDLNREKKEKIPVYKLKKLMVLDSAEGEEDGKEDLLLTSAPPFRLQDLLSSTYDSFEIRSGNYSWNVEKNGQGVDEIACGVAPLDEAAMKGAARLKLPVYQGIDYVGYTFSTGIAPDILTVRCWDDEEIGNAQAQEESVTTYYYNPFLLELKKGKVYEFFAQWEKKSMERNGFYGTASYVLVTE